MMIRLGGRDYRLQPTYKALLALEEQSGTGLLTLAKRFADGSFTLADALAVLRCGLEGAGEVVPVNLGELLVAAGLAGLALPLAQFIHMALSGEDSAGKA